MSCVRFQCSSGYEILYYPTVTRLHDIGSSSDLNKAAAESDGLLEKWGKLNLFGWGLITVALLNGLDETLRIVQFVIPYIGELSSLLNRDMTTEGLECAILTSLLSPGEPLLSLLQPVHEPCDLQQQH